MIQRKIVKKKIKIIIKKWVRLFFKTKLGRMVNELIIGDIMNRIANVTHNNISMKFGVPNALNYFRIDTFSTKEPETLDWIDTFPKKSVLWDIGANVGLYSIYAARSNECEVFAFEPSIFNLELLARNIYINDLDELITIVPIPLNDKIGISQMSMSNTEWGGALSTFDKKIDPTGNPFEKIFSFQTLGISADEVVSYFGFSQPNYIKIDVDGIEHFILKGAENILKTVSGVLVEINDEYCEMVDISKIILERAGLTFVNKYKSEFATDEYQNTYNQIWIRELND